MSGMKPCKTCKAPIAKSAKVCPSCGAKQGRGWFGKVVAVIVVIIGLTMAFNDGNTSSESVEPHEVETYSVSTPFTTEDIEINVSKVVKLNTISGNILWNDKIPSKGGVFVAIKWSLTNAGNNPVSSFVLPDTMQLVSSDGATYDPDLSATMQLAGEWNIDSKVLSNLNPKITVEEVAVFEISNELIEQSGWMIKVGGIKMPLTYTK